MRLRGQQAASLVALALLTLRLSLSAAASQESAAAGIEGAAVNDFLRQSIPGEMAKAHIEGVAVMVVEAGEVVASQGFGAAHPGAGEDIDARTSVFRVGSMAKPITAALVLQLVDEGTVNLDSDVSAYVGFTVPKRAGRAVTLREILTHSTGFSDTYRLLFATSPRDFHSLGDYARTRLPPLIFTPGTQPAYSNYAFGLAGYMVERLRGKPFASVARERIFEPLQMTTATFRQPPEPALAAALVQGFRRGGIEPGPFEYVSPESAGGLSVSAADYTRFVRALIEGGALDGHRILSAASDQQMLTLQPGPEGAARTEIGMGLGVTIDRTRRNLTAVGHSGDTVQYHGEFRAYPERDLVIVALQNTEGPPLVRTIIREFEERFALTPPALTPRPNPSEDLDVAGTYATGRYSAHSFLGIGRLFQMMQIHAVPGGGIRIGTAPEPLTRVGPGLYQDLTRTGRRALFMRDVNGRVAGVRVEPYQTMMRVPLWKRPAVVFAILGVGVATALVTLLGFIGRVVWNALHARAAPAMAWRLAAFGALALLLCIGGLYATLTGMQAELYSMTAARDPWIRAFEVAGIVTAAAWIGFLLALQAYWPRARRMERVAAVLFAVGTLASLAVLIDYRVLTSTLNY